MWRRNQLLLFKQNPELFAKAQEVYRNNPVKFINHWGWTYDPRNVALNRPTYLPFILFSRQEEYIQFLCDCFTEQQNGLIEKSRDMGATWLAIAFSVWLWLYWEGSSIGWGSREQDLVDRIGDPDSIFEKIRIFIRRLPPVFWPQDFDPNFNMSFMRIRNPEHEATITGDIGDNIGRGGRKLIFFKDESAHYVHPDMIEAALLENTRCQIDLSSVHGLGSVFHRKREAGVDWHPGATLPKGKTRVFVMDWRDHPEKTQEWYDLKRADMVSNGLVHKFAQEIDRDYAGSVEGVIIPAEWVRAAIDAHLKIPGFDDSGNWCCGLDVADEGEDTNALACRRGSILRSVEEWGERDTGATARRAVKSIKDLSIFPIYLQYDCNGVGSGVKAETNRLAEDKLLPKNVRLAPWDAGSSPLKPEGRVVPGDRQSPLNKDFYANLKAQGWWQLRRRFENTYRAINEPEFTYDIDDLISIDSTIPLLRKLEKELSQPTMGQSTRLKLLVNKQPEGAKSPNLADAVMMCFWPVNTGPLIIAPDVLARARMPIKGYIPRGNVRSVPRGQGSKFRRGYV